MKTEEKKLRYTAPVIKTTEFKVEEGYAVSAFFNMEHDYIG